MLSAIALESRVYPRVCGGTFLRELSREGIEGLSPRVRGNQERELLIATAKGSIPACAGEPSTFFKPTLMIKVYPRVCGGTNPCRSYCVRETGLSPRVRGNLAAHKLVQTPCGSIPACAGEPRRRSALPCEARVYPRVCGGTHSRDLHDREQGGSIPACAGEPSQHCRSEHPCGVYPRVCGGTRSFFSLRGAIGGLSPRVRGNRSPAGWPRPRCWSIPACAGEPQPGRAPLPA